MPVNYNLPQIQKQVAMAGTLMVQSAEMNLLI